MSNLYIFLFAPLMFELIKQIELQGGQLRSKMVGCNQLVIKYIYLLEVEAKIFDLYLKGNL